MSGFVRGGGQEQLANGVNPAFNRERFEEAHDLIVKTWTTPGPFRWEGTHYQHRVVNPWAVPMQKPHPRIWIPGVISKETIIWAAQHGYPYIALNTPVERTKQIWKMYDDEAAKAGFAGGSGVPRTSEADPCRRNRREGAGKRASVPVDAGRVHRPGAPGLEHAGGLLQPGEPSRLRRVRSRPFDQPTRASRSCEGSSRR